MLSEEVRGLPWSTGGASVHFFLLSRSTKKLRANLLRVEVTFRGRKPFRSRDSNILPVQSKLRL